MSDTIFVHYDPSRSGSRKYKGPLTEEQWQIAELDIRAWCEAGKRIADIQKLLPQTHGFNPS